MNRLSADVSRLIERRTPAQFALNKSGYLLISYADFDRGGTSAWRLYGPRDNVIAQGRDGAGPIVVGTGFLLYQNSSAKFLDLQGRLSAVMSREGFHRTVGPDDIVIPEAEETFNPRAKELFVGTAVPNGVVTFLDGEGRFWALGRHTPGRTVVRSACPGGAWTSRDLGPRIGAQRVTGSGKVIMVTGMSRMYLSKNGGQTWRLLSHGARVYSGIPEFGVTTDGSIVAGDERAGWRISHDLETFHDATADEVRAAVRQVVTRGHGPTAQLTVDGVHWEAFSIPALRRLLRPTSR